MSHIATHPPQMYIVRPNQHRSTFCNIYNPVPPTAFVTPPLLHTHHGPVNIPECSLLAVQNLPLCFFLLPVNPEERGRAKCEQKERQSHPLFSLRKTEEIWSVHVHVNKKFFLFFVWCKRNQILIKTPSSSRSSVHLKACTQHVNSGIFLAFIPTVQ